VSSKIKPCPFCGSTRIIAQQYIEDGRLKCENCKAEGPYLGTESEMAEAFDAWNRRAKVLDMRIVAVIVMLGGIVLALTGIIITLRG